MKTISILILFFTICSCQREFVPNFDGIEINNNHCRSSEPCSTGIDLWKLSQNHDTIHNCLFVPIADCVPVNQCDTIICDDGSFCTVDVCDSVSGCLFTEDCNDWDGCTNDVCDGIYCSYQQINCSDGDNCTHDVCAGGVCINPTLNCDDGNSCTVDGCAIKSGVCDNIDTCLELCSFDTIIDPTFNEWCKVVVCVDGVEHNTVRSCDDGDLCTNDICYSEQCHNPEVNCDDGSGTGLWWCDDATGYCLYGSPKMDEPQVNCKLTISPNPFTDFTSIQFEDNVVMIFDVSGRKLTGWNRSFTFTAPEGVYFAKMKCGDIYIVAEIISQ